MSNEVSNARLATRLATTGELGYIKSGKAKAFKESWIKFDDGKTHQARPTFQQDYFSKWFFVEKIDQPKIVQPQGDCWEVPSSSVTVEDDADDADGAECTDAMDTSSIFYQGSQPQDDWLESAC